MTEPRAGADKTPQRPQDKRPNPAPHELRAFPLPDSEGIGWEGMSLLDYFAGQALAGMPAQWHDHKNGEIARAIYDVAEAMCRESLERHRGSDG